MSDIEKMFFVYEGMLLLEPKWGKLVPLKELEKRATSTRTGNSKIHIKIKISKREFWKIVDYLKASGFIFGQSTRKGFIQRALTFDSREIKKHLKIWDKGV